MFSIIIYLFDVKTTGKKMKIKQSVLTIIIYSILFKVQVFVLLELILKKKKYEKHKKKHEKRLKIKENEKIKRC